jgi:SulP family sulfate permease
MLLVQPAVSASSPADRLRADVFAAFTVALVGLPQCLAYAMMSGLPPAYGLATAAVPGFVAALFGKSPHVVTGPTNTTGLLILGALGPFLGDNGLLAPAGLGVLATLGLMAGLVRILVAYAGGAALIDFIPESVLAGFTAGAGVLIMLMQLDEALGLTAVRGGSLLAEVTGVVAAIRADGIAWPALLVTALTAIAILTSKRVRPTLPTALIVVAVATLVALLAKLDRAVGLPVVSDRAAVPAGWPEGALPVLDPELIKGFIGPAAAIALLGTMELAVSARRGGARPDMRREIVAQGAANIAGAFASAFPASASLTRSALLQLGGARTRAAAALAALVVVPILLFGNWFVAAMPQASLAGVLFVVAVGMVDLPRMRRMWRAAPTTRLLLVVTFFATLVLPLEWAIFASVGLGLAQHLAAGRTPRLQLLEPKGERLIPVRPEEAGPVVVLEVSGDCHFAAAGALLSGAEGLLPPHPKHVIVDLTHARALRFAALQAFERFSERVEARGGALHLAGVDDDFRRMIQDTGSPLHAQARDPEPLRSVRTVLGEIDAPSP